MKISPKQSSTAAGAVKMPRTSGQWKPGYVYISIAGVMLVVALACINSLHNGFVIDDRDQILSNPLLHDWSTLWRCFAHNSWWNGNRRALTDYYRPLQVCFYVLSFHTAGDSPARWHAIKLALHLAAVVLALCAARLLTKKDSAALLAALLFGILPAQAEVVSWISSVPESLVAIFELGALCLLAGSRTTVSRIGAVLAYAVAIFGHESAITFPAIVACWAWFFDSSSARDSGNSATRERAARAAIVSAPYFVTAIVYLVARTAVVGFAGFETKAAVERPDVGQSLATIPAALWAYVKMAALVWTSGPIRRVPWVGSFASWAFIQPLALVCIVAAAFVIASRLSARRDLYLFCGSWFVLSLIPAMDLYVIGMDLTSIVADRYYYVASFGVCVIAADLSATFAAGRPQRAWILWPAAAVAVVGLTVPFWRAQGDFRDDVTVLKAKIAVYPDAVEYHRLLAQEFEKRNDLRGAEREYKELTRLDPDKQLYHFYLALIERKLGNRKALSAEYMKSMPRDITPLLAQPQPSSTPVQ